MTPAEAFRLLQARRVDEIVRGRSVQELSGPELLELLRVYGYPIPRFETEQAERAWEESEEAEAALSRIIEKCRATAKCRRV